MTTHGESDTRLARVWYGMKERCYCQTIPAFKNYGGRGIKVYDEWINDYSAFAEWAMNNGYSDGLSIDRIDVNGDYEPSNCRWATPKEQAINRRNCRMICYEDNYYTAKEFSEKIGVKCKTIYSRIYSLRRMGVVGKKEKIPGELLNW